uniref:Uncharacterized protein n=1 Tax=Poecilia reticulata TaxID=8081 RepID=A0A3P9PBK6_POERE
SVHPQPAEFGSPPSRLVFDCRLDDDITCLEGFATDITVICLDLTQYGIILMSSCNLFSRYSLLFSV